MKAERGSLSQDSFSLPNFDLKPYGFQQEILDQIQVERQLHQRNKHLIVAATGTGKTMIAAFDFRQWRKDYKARNANKEPRLLFVAHRKEILKQSLFTFRAVLRDQNFGDLMVDGIEPKQSDQLFISIQTFNARDFERLADATSYDYVVVDEFHHAAAPSYQSLLQSLQPATLLGLTATPERADDKDIRVYFDDHVTAEIRLPDAINRKLLSPFHYYGISDSVDYSGLQWRLGGYLSSELSNMLSANDVRAKMVLQKTDEIVLDIQQVSGLGFCVSKAHAAFMAKKFNTHGVSSAYLTADSPQEERNQIQNRLVNKEIKFIFVVDLYNEGVDIPEIDTVLFLRPTESLTVFLQQLGRGLRLHEDKDCLTVLDFVGQSHQNFRYDLRFNGLINNKKQRVDDEIEAGFPHLPAGCSIQLERKAKQYILENIKNAFFKNKSRIFQHIRSFTADVGLKLTLQNFLDYYRMESEEIYKRDSWSRLCAIAGEIDNFNELDEQQLAKGLRRLQHTNDSQLIDNLTRWLKAGFVEDTLSDNERKQLTMLHFSLWGKTFPAQSLTESLDRLDKNPTLKNELCELLSLCRERITSIPETIELPFSTPLQLHANYTLNEILVGLGHHTLNNQPAMREGVLHLQDINTDAFFITLNKSEKHYSPTTLYEDYAINEELFHWQSQSNTSVASPTGQRYINHKLNGHNILLFVRENRKNKNGYTEPYYFLGPAEYVSHEGDRPISFIWKLNCPMPAHIIREAAHLAIV